MAVTPYQVAQELYASNMLVAEQNALEVQHRLLDDYTAAKADYQSKHQHYSSRGRLTPAAVAASPPAETAAAGPYTVASILDYTEGQDAENTQGTSGGPSASPDSAAALGEHGPTKGCSVATNTPQFGVRSVPHEMVISYPAFTGSMMPADPLFRGAVADVQATCALFSVAEIRRAIEDSQRDLIERAMFPGLRRKPLQIEPSRELALKDAQPLWERVQALRRETESEEEITFRNLQLGHEVQRDLLARGILQLNPENKLIMVGPVSPAPSYYADAIQFAFRAEKLAVETMEESGRMNLIDEAWDNKTNILACFFETVPLPTE